MTAFGSPLLRAWVVPCGCARAQATLFMLELDNLAFDFGLTVKTKQRVQTAWEVVLEDFQARMLNAIRRWHVSAITIAIPLVIILSVRLTDSTWYRQVTCFIVFLLIIAFGELIELIFLFRRRSPLQNAQRVVCYVLKVPLFAIFNTYASLPIIESIPHLNTPWDPMY